MEIVLGYIYLYYVFEFYVTPAKGGGGPIEPSLAALDYVPSWSPNGGFTTPALAGVNKNTF